MGAKGQVPGVRIEAPSRQCAFGRRGEMLEWRGEEQEEKPAARGRGAAMSDDSRCLLIVCFFCCCGLWLDCFVFVPPPFPPSLSPPPPMPSSYILRTLCPIFFVLVFSGTAVLYVYVKPIWLRVFYCPSRWRGGRRSMC